MVSVDREVTGALALSDTIKPSALEAVQRLRAMGMCCILLSGDNEETTRRVGAAIGVDAVVSGSVPTDKVALVRKLQYEGRSVAVVGDGVNDGPVLAAADLGLAIGSGTDVAINAADMILLRDDLCTVPDAISLARRTLRTIRGNLVWAFGYNVAAVPLAAFGFLDPLIAAASMALSSTFVIWNSSRLRRFGSVREAERQLGEAGSSAPTPSPRRHLRATVLPDGRKSSDPPGCGERLDRGGKVVVRAGEEGVRS